MTTTTTKGITNVRFSFHDLTSARDDVQDQLLDMVRAAEGRSRNRLLTVEHVEHALDLVEEARDVLDDTDVLLQMLKGDAIDDLCVLQRTGGRSGKWSQTGTELEIHYIGSHRWEARARRASYSNHQTMIRITYSRDMQDMKDLQDRLRDRYNFRTYMNTSTKRTAS